MKLTYSIDQAEQQEHPGSPTKEIYNDFSIIYKFWLHHF